MGFADMGKTARFAAMTTKEAGVARKIIITGALGNIGAKVSAHLAAQPGYEIIRFDRTEAEGVQKADFAEYDALWTESFAGADTVIHLAGEPSPRAAWASVQRNNIVATQNILRALEAHLVPRMIFATTNQVMGGYRNRKDLITTDIMPAPLNPYAVSKLFCEEACRAHVAKTGLSVIAFRIGNIMPGENLPEGAIGLGTWGQEMWLSNRDMLAAMDLALAASAELGFALVNLVSNNEGMRWDLEGARKAIGYVPQDGMKMIYTDKVREDEARALAARLEPGKWLDQYGLPLEG